MIKLQPNTPVALHQDDVIDIKDNQIFVHSMKAYFRDFESTILDHRQKQISCTLEDDNMQGQETGIGETSSINFRSTRPSKPLEIEFDRKDGSSFVLGKS